MGVAGLKRPAMGMLAAAAHTRLLIAPSNLRIFLASPCLGAPKFRTRLPFLVRSRGSSRHLRWRAGSGVALPNTPGVVVQQRRYVQCARSSVQAETAVQVENSEDVPDGSLGSRGAPTFQQAIQRLQVGFSAR